MCSVAMHTVSPSWLLLLLGETEPAETEPAETEPAGGSGLLLTDSPLATDDDCNLMTDHTE